MGSIKRIADMRQKRATACLNCGQAMPRDKMKNGATFYCGSCGFAHAVRRAGDILTLTGKQGEEPGQDAQADRIRKLEARLKESLAREKEWRAAAEGLARMIEGMAAGDTKPDVH